MRTDTALPPEQSIKTMALIEGILPPSRENWEWIVYLFQFFPLVRELQLPYRNSQSKLIQRKQVTVVQWAQIFGWLPAYYFAGKTSTESRFNVPGKIGWITMEVPGFMTVLYIMFTLPDQLGVKLQYDNWIMAGAYVSSPTLHVTIRH